MTIPDDTPTSPETPSALGRAVMAPSCSVVDSSSKMNAVLLAELRRQGRRGVVRTVPLPGVSPAFDVDAGELALILGQGLGSWWYQHPRFPGWKPREHDPEADARWAVKFARAAGYAPGTHGFVDAEGMSADTTAAEAHAYNSAWAHVVVEEGFRAGLYDGYSQPETPDELYALHDVDCYWSDLARRKVSVRGCAVMQGPEILVLGVRFDTDVVAPDAMLATPYWTVDATRAGT